MRQQLIYSVFVRNHTKAGTFQALEADLPRIKALGTDYVWLLPIHPIGVTKRKGDLGSPYAIKDYRAINPEYGSMADFEHLVDAIHAQGMKVMLDVVYNHTSLTVFSQPVIRNGSIRMRMVHCATRSAIGPMWPISIIANTTYGRTRSTR